MKDAEESGVPVIAVVNPGSGPGTDLDRPSYSIGMKALRESGVEVPKNSSNVVNLYKNSCTESRVWLVV